MNARQALDVIECFLEDAEDNGVDEFEVALEEEIFVFNT